MEIYGSWKKGYRIYVNRKKFGVLVASIVITIELFLAIYGMGTMNPLMAAAGCASLLGTMFYIFGAM